MNKINYLFGYLLFRMRNRWKSKKNIVDPESYADPYFISVISSPLINFFFFLEKITNIFNKHQKYYVFYILICILIPFLYVEYLSKLLKKYNEQFINHKWNKLPIVKYMYYFIAINIIILGIILRVL